MCYWVVGDSNPSVVLRREKKTEEGFFALTARKIAPKPISYSLCSAEEALVASNPGLAIKVLNHTIMNQAPYTKTEKRIRGVKVEGALTRGNLGRQHS